MRGAESVARDSSLQGLCSLVPVTRSAWQSKSWIFPRPSLARVLLLVHPFPGLVASCDIGKFLVWLAVFGDDFVSSIVVSTASAESLAPSASITPRQMPFCCNSSLNAPACLKTSPC